MFFQNRGHSGNPGRIDSFGKDAGNPSLGRNNQALNFNKEDSGSFVHGRYGHTGRLLAHPLAGSKETVSLGGRRLSFGTDDLTRIILWLVAEND